MDEIIQSLEANTYDKRRFHFRTQRTTRNAFQSSLQPDWQIGNGFFNRPIPAHTQILVHGQVFDTTIHLEQRGPSVTLFRPFDAHILIYTS